MIGAAGNVLDTAIPLVAAFFVAMVLGGLVTYGLLCAGMDLAKKDDTK